MAKDFDPRRILRKISNSLTRVCFERAGVVEAIPWDDLGETQVEPIFAAWQKMPDDKRRLIQLVLQDINELADERGVKVLVEEIQRIAPDRLAEFDAIVGQADRAMWTYLNVKMAFVVAAYFARAEALSTGRYWITRNSLPKEAIAVDDSHKAALKAALAEFYWDRQLRGKICEIEHYTRIGGSEYFFAYLDDYPEPPTTRSNAMPAHQNAVPVDDHRDAKSERPDRGRDRLDRGLAGDARVRVFIPSHTYHQCDADLPGRPDIAPVGGRNFGASATASSQSRSTSTMNALGLALATAPAAAPAASAPAEDPDPADQLDEETASASHR